MKTSHSRVFRLFLGGSSGFFHNLCGQNADGNFEFSTERKFLAVTRAATIHDQLIIKADEWSIDEQETKEVEIAFQFILVLS